MPRDYRNHEEPHWTELRDKSFKEFVAKNSNRLEAKTPNQTKYMKAVESSTVTICTGPAGTGKTYLACGLAAQMFKSGKVTKIILSRPLVECDEEIGTLPGSLMEKVSDSMRPMLDHLKEFFTKAEIEGMLNDETLMIVPLAKMRGSTFKKSFILLDEAQNATYRQLKMFLTRLGEGSIIVVGGDHTQSDLKGRGKNSLLQVVERFSTECHKKISIVALGREDIVRHELIQWMDERLTDYDNQEEASVAGPAPSYNPVQSNKLICPNCKKTSYVEDFVKYRNLLTGCFHCKAVIELCDNEGFYEPITMDDDEKIEYMSKEKPV